MSCEVCHEGSARYTCPGCAAKTCCLGCVKKHKTDTHCDGRRNKTAFVALSKFSENNLYSDYQLLEDVSRKVDNSVRQTREHERRSRPKHLQKMVTQARKRGVTLKVLPYTFQRRRSNATTYWKKTEKLMWQIELVFPAAETKYTESRVSEDRTLGDLLSGYIHPTDSDPVRRHRLKDYVRTGMDHCALCLMQEDVPANVQRFYRLDLKKTVAENLKGKCIVEFPSILVVLPTELSGYNIIQTSTDQIDSSPQVTSSTVTA